MVEDLKVGRMRFGPGRFGQKGFTLIEMLLSVAIIAMLIGTSVPLYISFQNRDSLNLAADMLANSLRRARTYSSGVWQDSAWGVNVSGGVITLFKGSTYATRDTAYDESYAMSGAITASGVSEVDFAKLTALPSTTGSITLTNTASEQRVITINAKGMVDY